MEIDVSKRGKRRNLVINAVNLDSKHDPIYQHQEKFFKQIIHENKINAESNINVGTFTGDIIRSTQEFKKSINENEETKKENAIKEEKKQEREERIENEMKRVENKEFDYHNFKDGSHVDKNTQMGIEQPGYDVAKNLTDAEDIKNYNRAYRRARQTSPQFEELSDKYRLDKDHLYTPQDLFKDKKVLRMFLDATENGTLEEVVQLVNDEENLVTVFHWINASRKKNGRADIRENYGAKNAENLDKIWPELQKQYAQAYNVKDKQLADKKIAELAKFNLKNTFTTKQLAFNAYFRMIVTNAIYGMCDFFTGFVEEKLLEHTMCETKEPLSLGRMIEKLKDKFINAKDNAVTFYKDIMNKLQLPSLHDLFDAFKNATLGVFNTATAIIRKVKDTIKGVKSITKGIFSESAHDRHKALVGAAATVLAGSFAYLIQGTIKLIPMLEIAIKTLITTIAKIALTIVYTIMDLQDKYGEVMKRYNVFAI